MQGRLPLFRVVFVDWHGVLSNEPFWSSLLGGRNDRLRRDLERRLSDVFSGDLAETWMRGQTSLDRIVAPVKDALGSRRRPDFLQRRLHEDCLHMAIDHHLAELLPELVRTNFVVLATDNTADFERAFRAAAEMRRTVSQPPTSLRELAPLMDDIICSSAHGVLKAEDPEAFFGPWLRTNGMAFADAVLVDDRYDNCVAFERAGGRAIRWPDPDPRRALRDRSPATSRQLSLL
jgi:hypothetical protein